LTRRVVSGGFFIPAITAVSSSLSLADQCYQMKSVVRFLVLAFPMPRDSGDSGDHGDLS
jgi:hypothetical protein